MVSFPDTLIAQEQPSLKGSLEFGVEGGVQFTGVSDASMFINDRGTGYNFGPVMNYYLSELFIFRAGLSMDNRAFSLGSGYLLIRDDADTSYTGRSSYINSNGDYRVNYLTIPLSIIYSKGTGKFKLYVQGTVYYSILLNSKQSGIIDIYIDPEDAQYFDFKEYPELNVPGHHYLDPEEIPFNTSDIGIKISLGGIYKVSDRIGISLSAGFTQSFSNVWEDPLRIAKWSSLYKINTGFIYSIK